MGWLDRLQKTAEENGHEAACAKLESGAYVVFISPKAQDKVNAVLRVAVGIASQEEGKQQ